MLLLSLLVVLLAIQSSCALDSITTPNLDNINTDHLWSKLRPKYHYLPYSSWINDPNAPIYYEHEDGDSDEIIYHLFYQTVPNLPVWGLIHWGHAYSYDLINWQETEIALTPTNISSVDPDSPGYNKHDTEGTWSGNGIILANGNNSSVLQVFYTGVTNRSPFTDVPLLWNETQNTAFVMLNDSSFDKLGLPLFENFTKYKNNPLIYDPPYLEIGLKNRSFIAGFRDPFVFETSFVHNEYHNTI